MKFLLPIRPVILAAQFISGLVAAQTWTHTSAPNISWVSVVSSADGMKLAAIPSSKSASPIFLSTNSGLFWSTNYTPSDVWGSLASSADGNVLIAGIAGYLKTNRLYLSTNNGFAWILQTNAPNIVSLACSADGRKWIASAGSNGIYTTTNAGVSWIHNDVPIGFWGAVASSSDGNRLLAAATVNQATYIYRIYSSQNGGSIWTQTSAPGLTWNSIASSADGTCWAATATHTAYTVGAIYVSTNSGTNWSLSNAANYQWSSVASSADGKTLLAVAHYDNTAQHAVPINISTNGGNLWTQDISAGSTNIWHFITTSADGAKSAAISIADGGGIWTAKTLSSPTLHIQMSGGLKFSWAIPSTNFVLQQSADLASWSDVTDVPVLNLTNLQNQVTLPLSGANSFYRLKTP